jgi:hypothetical protein
MAALRSTGAGVIPAAALGAALALACNSDEKLRAATDDTTDTGTSDETTDTGEESTEDTGPPPDKTCRDGVQCMLACAAQYPANPTPEDPTLEDYLLSCFLECGKDLDAEEALAMIELVSCISDGCYGSGVCVAGESTEECTACLVAGLLEEEPPGCEAQGMACT